MTASLAKSVRDAQNDAKDTTLVIPNAMTEARKEAGTSANEPPLCVGVFVG